jgi:hypothetical protein
MTPHVAAVHPIPRPECSGWVVALISVYVAWTAT